MKNLTPSNEDAWRVFEGIRDAKQEHRSTLLALSSPIQHRYAQYNAHQRNLEQIPDAVPPFDAQHVKALKHCYDVETLPLKQLKTRIKRHQSPTAQGTCQYCGIDSPGTWDHYLPQSLFPEFAVHPHNLLMCCPTCNSKRVERWREDGERLHINLYFDQVEANERFLVAHISFENDLPNTRFEVDLTRGQNQEFACRYERHCRKLGLLDRFQEQAPGYLERIGLDILRSGTRSADAENKIAGDLRDQAADLQCLVGANHWEVALLAAAAESREFIAYCLRTLPEYGEVST